MTIKEILSSLSKNDKAALNYSFEHGVSQYVEYEPGKFVGVNVRGIRNLKQEQEAGSWAAGQIVK